MYGGRIVEEAPVGRRSTSDSLHPYSEGLLQSFPALRGPRRELAGIPGSPPDLRGMPTGCSFHPRCPQAFDRAPTRSRCSASRRPRTVPARTVACWLHPVRSPSADRSPTASDEPCPCLIRQENHEPTDSAHRCLGRSRPDRRPAADLPLGRGDVGVPDRGRGRRGRPDAVHLGHLLPGAGRGRQRRHRRRRLRPLPPDARRTLR